MVPNPPFAFDAVDDQLKSIIQHLYEIQSSTHGYLGPETQAELVRQITALTSSLTTLQNQTAPSNPRRHQLPLIPPEVVAYVDSSRNPDIYTREFVELVQKGQKTAGAKSKAFSSFRDVLAEEIKSAMPEIKEEVERIEDRSRRKEGKREERS